MSSHLHGFGDLQERLLKLEKQNHRLKQLGAAALIIPALLLVMGQAPSRKTVEASEFILRDNSENVRARLSVDEKLSAAQFVLFDKEGKQRIKADSGLSSFGSRISGGTITIADEHGRDRVFLSSDDFGGGTLSLLDQKGVPGTVLHTDNGNLPDVTMKVVRTPMVALEGNDERIVGMLHITDKAGALTLTGTDGKEAVTLGPKVVGFRDSAGVPTAYLSQEGLYVTDDQGFAAAVGAGELMRSQTGETIKRSAASIVLFDKNKNVIWKAP